MIRRVPSVVRAGAFEQVAALRVFLDRRFRPAWAGPRRRTRLKTADDPNGRRYRRNFRWTRSASPPRAATAPRSYGLARRFCSPAPSLVAGLPPGKYKTKYTISGAYDIDSAEIILNAGAVLQATIPNTGVITVFRTGVVNPPMSPPGIPLIVTKAFEFFKKVFHLSLNPGNLENLRKGG